MASFSYAEAPRFVSAAAKIHGDALRIIGGKFAAVARDGAGQAADPRGRLPMSVAVS